VELRLDRRRRPAFTHGLVTASLDADPPEFPLYLPELPLQVDEISPEGDGIAGCIRDSGSDGWGRRVIRHRRQLASDADEPGILDDLVLSGSDRAGALDVQVRRDEPKRAGAGSAAPDSDPYALEGFDEVS
jgi:hypothetical protein